MSDSVSLVQHIGVAHEAFEPMLKTVRPRPQLLRFGIFELDVSTGELRKEGRLIHLRHQPVCVLRLLLEKAGDLVTRREITESLWPDDIDVDVEQGLNHCMKEIRAVLGDRPDSPRFIQTLPRRGYRFLIEVHDGRQTVALDPPEAGPVLREKEKPADSETDQWLGDGRFE